MQVPAWCCLPWLPVDSRNVLRAAQRLFGPSSRCAYGGGSWRRILLRASVSMDAMHALTNVDLAALAAGLRTGRLGSPYSSMAVQRFCPESRATLISADLELLASQGMT